MIIIDDKILSDEIIEKDFVCNLTACKGACCVEGDQGALLEEEEAALLENIYEKIKPCLTPEGIAAIEEQGKWVREEGDPRTPLIKGGACAYITYDSKGTALCGIEKAYRENEVDFMKPVSCHLYPIRVKKNKEFEAVNYSRWDICDPACTLGAALKVPVYRFLKVALIRKYGEKFYAELEAIALKGKR